jgi:heat shock protein HtpX
VLAKLLLRNALTAKINKSKNNNSSAAAQIFLLALAAAFYICGYLIAPFIKFAISHTREFQTDALPPPFNNKKASRTYRRFKKDFR